MDYEKIINAAVNEVIEKQSLKPYKMRKKRQRKQRGVSRIKSRQYYKRHKQQILRKQKRYRKIRKPQLKLRRKISPHYKRIGEERF